MPTSSANPNSFARMLRMCLRLLAAASILLSAAGLEPVAAQETDVSPLLAELPEGLITHLGLSADGRYAVFASTASNLAAGDTGAYADIFLLDRQRGQVNLVSRSSRGVAANGWSSEPVVSASGQYVAFTSLAYNLTNPFDPRDTNGAADVFVYDRSVATVQRVSLNALGEQLDGWSSQPSLSADGRYVAFTSNAGSLQPQPTSGIQQVYVRDLRSPQIQLASAAAGGQPGDGPSFLPAISASGRFVTYISKASNLEGAQEGASVYMFDTESGAARRLPLPASADPLDTGFRPVLSGDGGRVIFATRGRSGITLYVFQRESGQSETIGKAALLNNVRLGGLQVGVSADGRWLAYPTWGAGTSGQVMLQSLVNETSYSLGSLPAPLKDVAFAQVSLAADAGEVAFSMGRFGQTQPLPPGMAWGAGTGRESEGRTIVMGWITDGAGGPLAGVTVTTLEGRAAVTDSSGGFLITGLATGENRVRPELAGYEFTPEKYDIEVLPGLAGAAESGTLRLAFTGVSTSLVTAARQDIGMPYGLNRGCPSPFTACGGPFSGFHSGDCTDLVLDAFRSGIQVNLQSALEQDLTSNPRWYYRWRNQRSSQDMWRFFAYRGLLMAHSQAYLPGDVVFFDWETDGRMDHVAVVSDTNERGRPTRLVDATGVVQENPSGKALEFDWQTYHEATVQGHARWTSGRGSGVSTSFGQTLAGPASGEILLVALDSTQARLRLRRGQQDWISVAGASQVGTRLAQFGPSQVISLDAPQPGPEWWTIEVHSPLTTTFQLGIQLVGPGLALQQEAYEAALGSGDSLLYLVQLRQGQSGLDLQVVAPPETP